MRVAVGRLVGVCVRVLVGVIGVFVLVGVFELVGVKVREGVGVSEGVGVLLGVKVFVGVFEGVLVRVCVAVLDGV